MSTAARPLSALALLALALATAGGLEWAVARHYDAPVPALLKARAYRAQAMEPGPQLIVMGTCLPEQTIDLDELARQLGGGTRTLNLAAPATGPRVWALTVDEWIPEGADVRAIVVPYGHHDPTIVLAPWESQAVDVAGWDDMPFLVRNSCTGPACASDLVLRKASKAYRYRQRLANALWAAVGARPPEDGPVGGPHAGPGEGGPADIADHARIDATGAPIQGREVAEGAALPAEVSAAGLGWAAADDAVDWSQDDLATFLWFDDFLARAQARGIPVILVPLPLRSDLLPRRRPPSPDGRAYRARLLEAVDRYGARHFELGADIGLTPEMFEDEVHVGAEGRRLITRALADRLREEL
ncbi:MAG: hypothetical protein H6742_01735 [Alphaproteobacteria bacterium]|nr:hypothetical protein [Alphaproteobacteria bacterium]